MAKMDNEVYADRHISAEIRKISIVKISGYEETQQELVAQVEKRLLEHSVGAFHDVVGAKGVWGRVRYLTHVEIYGNNIEDVVNKIATALVQQKPLAGDGYPHHAPGLNITFVIESDD